MSLSTVAPNAPSKVTPPQDPKDNLKVAALPQKPGGDDTDSDSDSDSDGEVLPTINDVISLRQGIIKTKKNISNSDYTILVVGETGVGKSSVLEFIANVLAGNKISKYNFDIIDQANEAGGSGMHSQTNSAKLYELKSQSGIKINILDTPGLADTRGIEQDEKHKRSIAKAIADSITTVNAILILANGTVPRITVGTDYALSTLSSIFPRSLADNIAFLFTNVSSPLSWNFAQDTVPPVLKDAPQFLLDNPLALQKKYLKLKDSPNTPKQLRREMKAAVAAGEEKGLQMLVRLFDWLDGLAPQPTKEILSLYEQSQQIETQINNTLAQMDQAALKKQEITKAIQDLETAKNNMEIYKQYEHTAKRKVQVQKPTEHHNTLCTVPQCYSNCHTRCGLNFTLDPEGLRGCTAMQPTRDTCNVRGCGHSRSEHRHYNVIWEEEEQTQDIVDPDMKQKFFEAQGDKEKKESLKSMLESSFNKLTETIEENTAQLSKLAEQYAGLSLSGSFSGQVEKAVKMLEQNYESMKQKGMDSATLGRVQKSLDEMKRKLELLKKAQREKKSSRLARVFGY